MSAVFVNANGCLLITAEFTRMNAGGIDICLWIFTNTCECRRGGIYIVYKLPSEKPLILNPAGQYIRIP